MVTDGPMPSTCDCEGLSQWQEYTGTQTVFNIPEDSEHCVEFYSEDVAGNPEPINSQCVYVDNQAPTPIKTVNEIKTKWYPNAAEDDYEASYFYPEETAHCWEDSEYGIECWKVTLDTPIDMTCSEDPSPHPVGFEQLCYKVGWDGEDITGQYCGDRLLNKDGYCCVDGNVMGFQFREESEHNLEYYCEDRLGNRKYDDEKFKVFGRIEEIPLYKKWNLISVPFDPINKEPEAVFSEVKEEVDSVWSYNAETKTWSVYRPSAEELLTNDLEEIRTGLGYWVMGLDNSELRIGGSLLSPGNVIPASVGISKGWNLIGHYGTEDKEAYCSLFSLVDTQQGFPRWSALWGYNNPSQTFKGLEYFGDYTKLGEGYWMESDVDETYAPATGCIYPYWYRPLEVVVNPSLN